jgi:hypothetical protein
LEIQGLEFVLCRAAGSRTYATVKPIQALLGFAPADAQKCAFWLFRTPNAIVLGRNDFDKILEN